MVDATASTPSFSARFEDSIKALNRDRAADAWNRLLNTDDVIGIKFNQVWSQGVGTVRCAGRTTGPFARPTRPSRPSGSC